jgi:hypothetical protein
MKPSVEIELIKRIIPLALRLDRRLRDIECNQNLNSKKVFFAYTIVSLEV